jgi:hypothetical protein
MTRSPRSLVGLGVVVTTLAIGAALWLRGGHHDDGAAPRREAARSAESSAPAEALPTEPQRAPLARTDPPHPAADRPATYAKALGAFTGRLLEPDLTPVKGLPVSAVEFEPSRYLLDDSVLLEEQREMPPLESARTKSDDEGRFLLAGLEPRAVHLLGIDLGGARAAFRVIDRSAVSGETVDLGDVVLEPFVTFTGRIVDEDGEPVEAARVRATNLPSMIFQFGLEDIRRGCGVMVQIADSPKAFEVPPVVWDLEKLLPIPTTTSDAQGKFKLPGVPLGLVTVIGDKAQFKASTKSVPSGKGPERNVGDLVLGEGFALDGVVVNGAKEPVAGVQVLAGIRSPIVPVPAALLQPAGRTDEKGHFSIKGLPSGSEAFVATRVSRGQPWNVHGPFDTGAAQLQVQLSPPSGLTVRAHDEAGKPVDAELFVAPDPIESGAPLPPILAPAMQKLSEVTTLEPGLFKVTGLDLGKYRVIGRAGGFALAQTKVEVAEPPREFELVFQPSNTLEIHVVRKGDKHDLEWAFASLCPEGIFERPVARGRTDDEGRVNLTRIPAGKYTLTVQHPAQATMELKVEVPSPRVEVELPLGGNLKGRVSSHGKDPGKSLFVILTEKGAKRPDAAMPTLSATAETGDFFVPNLEAGSYRYEIRDRIVGKGPLALFETLRDDPLAKGETEIREGETTELLIDTSGVTDGPTAQLYGTVWVNGNPAPDLSIHFEGARRVTAKSDERGAYRFEAVPAGKAVLTVQGLKDSSDLFQIASSMHREEVELAAGEARQLDFALEIAAVRGRVSGPGIGPVGIGATVILRSPDNNGLGQFASPNPVTGSYEFAHVARGKYDLLVRKRGAAPFTTTIDVDPTRGDVELDVELVASITVKGKLVLPDGVAAPSGGTDNPFGGSFLMLVDADQRPAGRGRVDWKSFEYTFDDCTPGTYQARLFLAGEPYVARDVAIPANGSSNLTLVFERPKEGETIVSPFPTRPGGGGRGLGPRPPRNQ